MTGILVQDQRKKWKRTPDYWMICKEKFTEEELSAYRNAMKRVKVSFLPDGVNCRWAGLMSKQEILDWLDWVQKKTQKQRK